ncbi:MAG: hypothetical protein JXO22_16275, partial [Phycisphaerae bacterium]|nr:hypothetical protein [Phycisphaerae bacterium]
RINLTRGRLTRVGWSQPRSPEGSHDGRTIAFKQLRLTPDRTLEAKIVLIDVPDLTVRELPERVPVDPLITWAPGDSGFAHLSANGVVAVTDRGTLTTRVVAKDFGDGSELRALEWSPVGDRIAVLIGREDNGTVCLIDPSSGSHRAILMRADLAPNEHGPSFCWGPGGEQLAVMIDGTLTTVDLNGKLLRSYGHATAIYGWSADGHHIAYCPTTPGDERHLSLVSVANGGTIETPVIGDTTCAIWHPRDARLACWNVRDDSMNLLELRPDAGRVCVLDTYPLGSYVAPSWMCKSSQSSPPWVSSLPDVAGCWEFEMTPDGGSAKPPDCAFFDQVDRFVSWEHWEGRFSMRVWGEVDDRNLTLTGEGSYYGERAELSINATIGSDGLEGRYEYSGLFEERGSWRARRGECRKVAVHVRQGVNDWNEWQAVTFHALDLVRDWIDVEEIVASGPHVARHSLRLGKEGEKLWGGDGVNVAPARPRGGDRYTFTVRYTDGVSETLEAEVLPLRIGFPKLLSPQEGMTVDAKDPQFEFRWQPPPTGQPSRYRISVVDNEMEEEVWSIYLPPNRTSARFNEDGSAKPLRAGADYRCTVGAHDPWSTGRFQNVTHAGCEFMAK